jgi:transposase
MGSRRECTWILGLEGFRLQAIEWTGEGPRTQIRIRIERRGVRGYECSGCRRRTWRVRDRTERTWDDLPWAEHRVTLVYPHLTAKGASCSACARWDKAAACRNGLQQSECQFR